MYNNNNNNNTKKIHHFKKINVVIIYIYFESYGLFIIYIINIISLFY